MLLGPDGWLVVLIHVVERLLPFLERVEERDEVADGVIVVCDEETPERGFRACYCITKKVRNYLFATIRFVPNRFYTIYL